MKKTTNIAVKAPKLKNLFPKLKRGGYTARVRFMDEARGERYFDASWSVWGYEVAGKFTLTGQVDYRGYRTGTASAATIGKALRVGDTVCVEVKKWCQIGQPRVIDFRCVKIVSVKIVEDSYTEVEYV